MMSAKTITIAAFILAFGLVFASCKSPGPIIPIQDTDGDGVSDRYDACPGFDDRLDADADGVPDGCDICPGFDDNIDTDGDGVPDGCDACRGDDATGDTDGDGVCDSTDACPGHDDGLDSDGDGVPDGCDLNVSATGYGDVFAVAVEGGGTYAKAVPAAGWTFAGWTLDGEPLAGADTIPAPAAGELAAAFRFAWGDGVAHLDEWLGEHQAIAAALVWEGDLLDPPDKCGSFKDGPWCGEVHGWPWPGEAQDSLFRAFEKACLGLPSGVSDAPPNAADTSNGDKYGQQRYFPADARAAFMAYAANSLAVEIGGLVPWSILDAGMYGPDELATLLDSRKFFNRQPDGTFQVSLVQHGGMSTMSAPETAMAFLRGDPLPYTELEAYHCRGGAFDCGNGVILSDTPTETIARTVHWFRLNVIHFMNHWWYGNTEAHWQYRGYTPAVRLMTGTARTAYVSDDEENGRRPTTSDTRVIPRTAGCWGTSGFMRTVLRAVNIPMELVTAPGAGHALPSFPSEARMGRPSHMSHGDDPYSLLSKTSAFPSHALLMTKAEWDLWFAAPPGAGGGPPADPTDEEIEEGFLDHLSPDIDYCGGDPDCGYAPPPEPEFEPVPGEPIVNTPKMWVGGRNRALSLSWSSWYIARKYCDGGRVPMEGGDLALRNWSMADLTSLDCSELPETGREDLFCHENFFEYLDEVIDRTGGCSAVGPGAGKPYYTYEEMAPMP